MFLYTVETQGGTSLYHAGNRATLWHLMGYSEVLLLFLTRQTHDILEHFLLVLYCAFKGRSWKGPLHKRCCWQPGQGICVCERWKSIPILHTQSSVIEEHSHTCTFLGEGRVTSLYPMLAPLSQALFSGLSTQWTRASWGQIPGLILGWISLNMKPLRGSIQNLLWEGGWWSFQRR